ncbi:MAG: hypothetical protein AB1391_04705, partial [Candidatus Micrarchaeota archaeon]
TRSVSTPKRKTDVDSNTTRSVSTPKRKTDVDSNTTRSVSTPKKKLIKKNGGGSGRPSNWGGGFPLRGSVENLAGSNFIFLR